MKSLSVFLSLEFIRRGESCSAQKPQLCTNSSACTDNSGVWIPVDPATYIPGTALVGGRRYTLTENDDQFAKQIVAPNGGYCTLAYSSTQSVSAQCEENNELCTSFDECFYRKSGPGRWFHTDISSFCVSNCSHPLVFCDKTNCQTTLGCSWFVLSQSTDDQCYCIDNPGIFGNPPPRPKLNWIFWDQPISMPVFVIAILAALGILYNILVTNVKPFFEKLLNKKPKE